MNDLPSINNEVETKLKSVQDNIDIFYPKMVKFAQLIDGEVWKNVA